MGPVTEMNPHRDVPRIPGVTPPPGYVASSGSKPVGAPPSGSTSAMKPAEKPRSYNDGKSEEHLKARSSEHPDYTNRQVGEARDNAVDNANRFGGPVTEAHVKDALKRLNGR